MSVRLRAAGILVVVMAATRAEAIPAFARKTGMSCSACHTAWPLLNQEGVIYRDNGYQLGLRKDEPSSLSPAYVPLSLRTLASYQATRATNQASDAGPVTTTSGGVPVPPAVDVLTAGTLTTDVSFLLVLTGFSPADQLATTESAWLRVGNLLGTGWLNFKIGKFEPDLPVSPHRNIFQTATPTAYSARFDGSTVSLDLASNQVGVELDGHDARSLTRYAISVFSGNNGGEPGANAWTHPVVYGHVQRAFELDGDVVPYLRVGAFGLAGWWPTQFRTLTNAADPAAPPAVVGGTGRDHRKYFRYGGELSGMFGSAAAPFQWTLVGMGGKEEASADGATYATVANRFTGGFVEIDWVPIVRVAENATPWAIFARYDNLRYRTGPGDVDGYTLGVRRYMAMGARTSAALHLEVHQDRTKGVGAADAYGTPTDVTTQMAIAGFDFSF